MSSTKESLIYSGGTLPDLLIMSAANEILRMCCEDQDAVWPSPA